MEDDRKREGQETQGDDVGLVVKRPRGMEEGYDGDWDMGEDIMAWLAMDDDTVGELMMLLGGPSTETTTASGYDDKNYNDENVGSSSGAAFRVKFIDNPYSTPLIFQSSSCYITINGNEESCGSSFSDFESSVMASVDIGGIIRLVGHASGKMVVTGIEGFAAEGVSALGSTDAEARGWVMEDYDGSRGGVVSVEGMAVCDGHDLDPDWDEDSLARFLGEDLL